MKLWTTLRHAVAGWGAILAGRDGWAQNFSLSPAGLVTALIVYLLVAFLALAIATLDYGLPGLIGTVTSLAILSLPLVALAVTVQATRAMMGRVDPLLTLVVPAVYLLSAFLAVEAILAMFGPLVIFSWLVLAWFLYRLARRATGWNRGVATAFAVLTVLLLVAMRISLYMLTNPPGSPI